mmetsp:Transcript_9350/g.10659  ORF Transcript_9350/g.10659 Transcript_9350/m.10659 type:complete len:145 (+) Transcript_9350:90-524(+)
MKRPREKVTVIEFVDPFLQRANRSGKNRVSRPSASADLTSGPKGDPRKRRSEVSTESNVSRKDIFSEVFELGASAFDKRDKKALKKSQLRKLGCSVEKEQRLPFKIYQQKVRSDKRKRAKALAKQKESGVLTGKEKTTRKKKKK